MDRTPDKQSKTKGAGDTSSDKAPEYAVVGAPGSPDKRKKKGSSRPARRLEDIESRFSKSVHRISKAVNKGVTTYIDERDESARRRRDGALVDIYENVSKGIAETVADSSPVLTDIAKAFNTRRVRKQIRKFVRNIPLLG